jgi:ribose transport system permease protein
MGDARPKGSTELTAERLARPNILSAIERSGLLILLIAVIVTFSALRPDTFAQVSNIRNVATSQSVLAVIALALMFPLVAGRFDVSVGGTMSVSAITCTALNANHHWSLATSIVVAVAVSALIGVVNGFVVAYLGVNSIIATIGTGTVMGGLVQAYTHGAAIAVGISPTLLKLSNSNPAGIPPLVVLMLVIAVVVWLILQRTIYGRQIAATGSSLAAANLLGLRTRRIVLLSFVASGLLAGIAGVLQIALQGSGDPNAGGLAFILPALAAVFLGATTWRPGTYNVPGTLLSLFFIGITVNGLVLIGAEPWVTDVLNGAAVVLAIVISAQIRRRRTGTLEIGT